jgi:hypothetical protein
MMAAYIELRGIYPDLDVAFNLGLFKEKNKS